MIRAVFILLVSAVCLFLISGCVARNLELTGTIEIISSDDEIALFKLGGLKTGAMLVRLRSSVSFATLMAYNNKTVSVRGEMKRLSFAPQGIPPGLTCDWELFVRAIKLAESDLP